MKTNNYITTRRSTLRALFTALFCALIGTTQSADANIIISSETSLPNDQYEVIAGGLRYIVHGTPGRQVTVRLWQLDPSGDRSKHVVVGKRTVTLKSLGHYVPDWNVIRFTKGILAGSGIRYAFTIAPVNGKRTEVGSYVESTKGGSFKLVNLIRDPLDEPYPAPSSVRVQWVTAEEE